MKQKNKKCINKNALLDINVSDIFVVKNSKKRAFIEQFKYSSVNFTQKNLGTILGFFAVRNEAPSSENIVNFLASEVKKKYFAPIDASAEDKLELTLHHINRTLEEIANVGNVEWLGNIDSVICVITETSVHFSITGNAYVFLLRDDVLINIGEGLASTEASEYPLKTFVDISSGDLCPYDKIIITSQELLELISIEELQKNAIRFGQKNFIQFIETVLTNECSIATTTIIDIDQKEAKVPKTELADTKTVPKNLFGADAFEKDSSVNNPAQKELGEAIDVDKLIDTQPEEYTDPRTGHIHIQGNDEPIERQTLADKLVEKFTDTTELLKLKLKKSFKKVSNLKLKKNKTTTQTNEKTPTNTNPELNSTSDDLSYVNKNKTSIPQKTIISINRVCAITKNATKKTTLKCVTVLTKFKNKQNTNSITTPQDSTTIKKHSILPSLTHLKKLWQDMTTKTKLVTIGILLVIIFVPIIFSIISNNTTTTPETIEEVNNSHEETPEEVPTVTEMTKPMDTISNPVVLLEKNNIISTILMNNNQFGVLKNEVITLNNTKKDIYTLPSDAGEIKFATAMDDLDLIFFITSNNKIYSFSPSSKKIIEQKNIPKINVSEINTLSSYLTYLYTTDSKMINRYAREENGFANSENWLNGTKDFTNTTTLAIDADIYTASNGKISKFSKHKEVPFSQDNTIKQAYLIYTTPNTQHMWILDKDNKILFKTAKETGKKIEEFKHADFANALSLTIDEKNNTITISTINKILSFKL